MATAQSKALGKFLTHARTAAGLTQKEVADALKYSTSQFISNWERGVSLPPVSAFRTLATLYKLKPDRLVSEVFECRFSELEDEEAATLKAAYAKKKPAAKAAAKPAKKKAAAKKSKPKAKAKKKK